MQDLHHFFTRDPSRGIGSRAISTRGVELDDVRETKRKNCRYLLFIRQVQRMRSIQVI